MQENVFDKGHANEITLKDLIVKIRDYYRYLLKRWLIVFFVSIVGAALGFAYASVKKPIYTASTTFVLEEEKTGGSGLGSLAGLASIAGVSLGGGGGSIFQGENILELYKSRTMIEKTLLSQVVIDQKKEFLVNRYIEVNELHKRWDKKPELRNFRFEGVNLKDRPFSRLQDSVLGLIVLDINKNYLTVSKPDKKLSIIKAVVQSKDEIFAKEFNEQIVKNVNDFYVQTKTKKAIENVAILQQKTDSVRAVMTGAIYSSAQTLDATPNLNPTRQVLRTKVQRSQFSAETNKAVLEELVKNLEMSKIALRRETPLIQIVDNPVFPLEVTALSKLKATAVGLIICFLFVTLYFITRKIILDLGDF